MKVFCFERDEIVEVLRKGVLVLFKLSQLHVFVALKRKMQEKALYPLFCEPCESALDLGAAQFTRFPKPNFKLLQDSRLDGMRRGGRTARRGEGRRKKVQAHAN